MTTSSTYAVRRTQRQNAKLLQVAKSAIWRLLFSPQPPNRRFGEPEGSKASEFSPTLAWTYVPCCHLHFYYSTLLLHPPPKPPSFIGEVPQVGYPRQASWGFTTSQELFPRTVFNRQHFLVRLIQHLSSFPIFFRSDFLVRLVQYLVSFSAFFRSDFLVRLVQHLASFPSFFMSYFLVRIVWHLASFLPSFTNHFLLV